MEKKYYTLEESSDKEPLLQADNDRYSFLPIITGRECIIEEYKKQLSSFWIATQVDMKIDKKHWEEGLLYPNTTDKNKMKQNESAKTFIKMILAFFSGSDILVLQNLDENFIDEMKWLEVKAAYGFQSAMEMIHSEAYSLQIEELITDEVEKNKLFNAIKEIPAVTKKAEWVKKYMNRHAVEKKYGCKSFAVRLVAFAAIEGIMFSGEFAAIFWLINKNRMPGLVDYNDLISKDEGMHTDFACLLYTRFIKNTLTKEEMYEIINEATLIEIEFITDAISCDMIGMNKDDMGLYIKFVSNRLLLQLGYDIMYRDVKGNAIENPFSFMEFINLPKKKNFFEGRPTNYNIASKEISGSNIFSENAEF